jgi:hypothetical protein
MLLSFNNLIRSITICSLVLSIAPLVGQPLNWSQNSKYWSYRNRLVKQFVVRGEQSTACDEPSGLSIPAKLAFTHESDIRWADGGAQLGWYISVLATEYRLELLSGYTSVKHSKNYTTP